MLKPCRPAGSGVGTLSRGSVEYGPRRVQERARARGVNAHAKSGEVEATRGRQAARDPATSRQGPRPGDQSRRLEAEGLVSSGLRALTQGLWPGKSAGEPPL